LERALRSGDRARGIFSGARCGVFRLAQKISAPRRRKRRVAELSRAAPIV